MHLSDRYLEWIAIQHDHIGKHARFDTANLVTITHLERRIHRKQVHGLFQRDLLGLPQRLSATAQLLTCDQGFDCNPRIDRRHHRPIRARHHQSSCVNGIFHWYPSLHALRSYRFGDIGNDRIGIPDIRRHLKGRGDVPSAANITHLHETAVSHIVQDPAESVRLARRFNRIQTRTHRGIPRRMEFHRQPAAVEINDCRFERLGRRHEQAFGASFVRIGRIRIGLHHRCRMTIGWHSIEHNLYAVWRKTIPRIKIAALYGVGWGAAIGGSKNDGSPHDATPDPLLQDTLVGQRRIGLHRSFIDAGIGERGNAIRQHKIKRPL